MPLLAHLLALVSLAAVVLSSGPIPDHARRDHHAIAMRRRSDTSTGRCNPRPSTSLPASSLPSPTYTPSPTPSPTYTPSPTSTPPPPTSAVPSTTSAAAPSSTSNSKKWILAWGADQQYIPEFASLSEVGSWYNWSSKIPDDLYGLQGMAMIWGAGNVTDVYNLPPVDRCPIVLGFNEPNEPKQANLDASYAASLWQTYMNPLKDQGYTLVSPACTNDQAGLDWYHNFMTSCAGQCKIDVFSCHCYTPNASDCSLFATTLYNTYGLPVMITEFADTDYSNSQDVPSMSDVWNFAGEMVNFVRNTPWILGAAPFGILTIQDLEGWGVDTANSLINADGSPTTLAEFYFNS